MRSSKHRHLEDERARSHLRCSVPDSADAHEIKHVHTQQRSRSILQNHCQSSAAQQLELNGGCYGNRGNGCLMVRAVPWEHQTCLY